MIKICTNIEYKILEDLSMQEIKHEINKIVDDCNNRLRNKVKGLTKNGFTGVDEISSINISPMNENNSGYYMATIVISTYDYFMNEDEIQHPLVISRPIERI